MINPSEFAKIKTGNGFKQHALTIFHQQSANCKVYADFTRFLNIDPQQVTEIDRIPFLPVEFFKTHSVIMEGLSPEIIFTSSGTTGAAQSRHLVADTSVYKSSYRQGFELFYGDTRDYVILALLPAYQEREGSSLIYMVDDLIGLSDHTESGYLLNEPSLLHRRLEMLKKKKVKTILIGVTYALLDFVEMFTVDFPELIVMETGGMKGRRKEMIREELHQRLCAGFGVTSIHSEYGMTELLSQGYSAGGGLFNCPPWMKVFARDTNDPFTICGNGQTGGINVIDLANVNSCSFIATQDLGKVYEDGSFEILGRFDNSDVRGCNLLVG